MKVKSIGFKISLVVIILSLVSLFLGYMVLSYNKNIAKEDVYSQVINKLQITVKTKLQAKKDVGISNAISIANDGKIKSALKNNNREEAIRTLKSISEKMKESTPFKNIKVHVHTKDNHSFVRAWKINKFGDDLSSFRASIVKVNATNKAVNTFELGKAGLSLRSVVPVRDDENNHLGSLEFMQGLNSVAKSFNKQGEGFLLLMDKNVSKIKTFSKSKMLKNYVISQKFVKKDFLIDAKTIDFKKLLAEKSVITGNFLYTYVDIKDFNNKKLGIALVGEPLKKVNLAIDVSTSIINLSMFIIIAMVLLLVLALLFVIKKVVTTPLENLNNAIIALKTSKNASSRVEVLSDDEIGHVADNFNAYLQSIEDGILEEQELIKEAEEVMGRVSHGWYSQYIEKLHVTKL